jgi:hypothetical protein
LLLLGEDGVEGGGAFVEQDGGAKSKSEASSPIFPGTLSTTPTTTCCEGYSKRSMPTPRKENIWGVMTKYWEIDNFSTKWRILNDRWMGRQWSGDGVS